MDDDDFDFDEEVAIEESVTADRARDMARQQGTGGQGDAEELAAFGVDDTRIDDAGYENARQEPAPVEVDARNDGDPNIKTVFIDSLFAAETMGDVTQSDAKRMEKAKYASAFAAAPTEFKNILSNMNVIRKYVRVLHIYKTTSSDYALKQKLSQTLTTERKRERARSDVEQAYSFLHNMSENAKSSVAKFVAIIQNWDSISAAPVRLNHDTQRATVFYKAKQDAACRNSMVIFKVENNIFDKVFTTDATENDTGDGAHENSILDELNPQTDNVFSKTHSIEPVNPIQPRYCANFAEFAEVGSVLHAQNGMRALSLGLLESNAHSHIERLYVPVSRDDPMLGPASFIFFRRLKHVLQSSVAKAVHTTDVEADDLVANFADVNVICALHDLDPDHFVESDEERNKYPVSQLEATKILAHPLWKFAESLVDPGDVWDGSVNVHVWLAGLVPSSKHFDLGHIGSLERTIGSDTMFYSRMSNKVNCRPGAPDHAALSSFRIIWRLNNKEITVQSVQDHVIEMTEVTDKRIVFRCGVPSYLSRNNLYNVKNWDQKSIDMANEQIRILHIRSCNTNQPNQSSDMYSGDEGGSDTELDTYDLATDPDNWKDSQSYLSSCVPLADASILWTVLKEPPRTEKSDSGKITDNSMKIMQGLLIHTLCVRNLNFMVRIKITPNDGKPSPPPMIVVCNEDTNLWHKQVDAADVTNRGKNKSSHPFGSDIWIMENECTRVMFELCNMQKSPKFYDTIVNVIKYLCAASQHHNLPQNRDQAAETLEWIKDELNNEGAERADDVKSVFRDILGATIDFLNTHIISKMRDSDDTSVASAMFSNFLHTCNTFMHRSMMELSASHPSLALCPLGTLVTADKMHYHWCGNRLVAAPLNSTHRYSEDGLLGVSPDHSWVLGEQPGVREKLEAFLNADYWGCTNEKDVVAAYVKAIETADALAETHPVASKRATARRVLRSMLRMFGYKGGIQYLLYYDLVTFFGMTEKAIMLFVTSIEDEDEGFIPGGGKSTLMEVRNIILSSRFTRLQSTDMSDAGSIRANPKLAEMVENKSLGAVVDEIPVDGKLSTDVTCTVVPGTGQPQVSPWRKLYESPLSEIIRIVTLLFCSNFYACLAAILVAGNQRRSGLIGLLTVFIEQSSMVQYGNFENVDHMNELFDGDPRAYAEHMTTTLPRGRVTESKDRHRLSSLVQWHQVIPKRQIINKEDAAMHLSIVMLFGAHLERCPLADKSPDTPEYSAAILGRLQKFQKRDAAKKAKKKSREDDDITDEQRTEQQKRDSTTIVDPYPLVVYNYNGDQIKTVKCGTLVGEDVPSEHSHTVTFNAPPECFNALYDYFTEFYEPEKPGEKQNGFYLKFLVDKLKLQNRDVFAKLQSSTGGARAGSHKWMVQAVNQAIDVHNGARYRSLDMDERSGWVATRGVVGNDSELSYSRKFYSPYPEDNNEHVLLSSIVYGYRAKGEHAKEEWRAAREMAAQKAEERAQRQKRKEAQRASQSVDREQNSETRKKPKTTTGCVQDVIHVPKLTRDQAREIFAP